MNDLQQRLNQMFITLNDLLENNNYQIDYLLEQVSTLLMIPQPPNNLILFPHLLQQQDPMFEARVLLRTKMLPELESIVDFRKDVQVLEDLELAETRQERIIQQKVEIIQDLRAEFQPVVSNKNKQPNKVRVEKLLQRINSHK